MRICLSDSQRIELVVSRQPKKKKVGGDTEKRGCIESITPNVTKNIERNKKKIETGNGTQTQKGISTGIKQNKTKKG